MNLNDLFKAKGISPEDVLVFRHRPRERELNKVLPWLASEKPELFNAYQQTQGPRTENAMLGAKYVASFIGNEPGKALFIGLYKIGKTTPITKKQFWKKPVHIALKKHGLYGFTGGAPSDTVLWFDLTLTDFYADWKGKLIVKWPPPELSWYRRAHRNEIPVFSILGESVLDKGMPNWDEITLTWDELQILPASWKAKLSEWRAIYYIYDTSIRKGYVGSAYGATNLLRRWLDYAARGHGGNLLLRMQNPKKFKFSILQRVSPDMEVVDVIRLEGTWKERLNTRAPFGLNDN